MGEHDGVYRYVRWHDVEEFKARGWVLVEGIRPAPQHDAYSALMRWAGEGEPKLKKQDVLQAAIGAVADRGLNYGEPEDNFTRIARYWMAHIQNRYYYELELDAADVAIMMALMKLARLDNSPNHMDSWIDLAGYAACGGEITGSPEETPA